jgi:mannose-6-phosphate isomerase-like protein (cupin superfamily)
MDASAGRPVVPPRESGELRLALPLRRGRGALGLGLARLPAGATQALAELRAGAAFIVDSAQAAVAPAALARMIGCFFFASVAGRGHARVAVRLELGAATAAARLARPAFEVERNGFGAAHVLYEDAALGLYVLELAPGRAIPAHMHRQMQESELVLDAGLMQQGRPVMPGDAFEWPIGLVHEYRNPTGAPRRILCIDRPRFIPEDEVVVPGRPELVPVAPACNYLA